MIRSKALEVNLASYHVEVEIAPRYAVLQDVMAKYYGLMEGMNTFLKELSHPRRNLQFIVGEARGYALNYFHLLKSHPEGHRAAGLYVDIFLDAIRSTKDHEVLTDAVDNLLLFIQKTVKDAGLSHIEQFMPVLDDAFRRIRSLDDHLFFLFVTSYYRMEKIGEELILYTSEITLDLKEFNCLLFKYFQFTYAYWLGVEDPMEWFQKEVEHVENREQLVDIFDTVSHRQIEALDVSLNSISHIDPNGAVDKRLYQLSQLLTLPGYSHFVDIYREIPQKLLHSGRDQSQGNRRKMIFLFHIMNIAGLALIHEEALRDINRTLGWLIGNEKYTYIVKLINDTFSILKTRTHEFPQTALSCILNMGKGLYRTDEIDLVKSFINHVSDLGFQTPMIRGVGNDWQIRVNPAHIQNIRTWLELIELNPKWSTRLLSDLIIHLSLTGVFIKDTDLFPRNITDLLNSDIGPVYNLVKQLARLFPVYFNDIGAEGDLREISTRIDEIAHRKDPLIHFLRKQAHVESSNRVVGFIESMIRFWLTLDKRHIEPYVPPSIFEQVDPDGRHVRDVHRIMAHLQQKGLNLPEDLLSRSEQDLKKILANLSPVRDVELRRVSLAVQFYQLLHRKYSLIMEPEACEDINSHLAQLKAEGFPGLDRLKEALLERGISKKLLMLLDYLEELKALILSNRTYEIREDIYKKRHITVDIPSMYGSYHEMKFNALGLTFRVESVVNVCFEEIVDNIDLSLITKETFYRIYDLLKLFDRGLKLDGISSVEFENQMELLGHSLETRGFTFPPYLDIFKGFARSVSNVINDYFNNIHENNLNRIISRLSRDQILEKYLSPCAETDLEKLQHWISELFLREKIAFSLGLRQLDLFLSRILSTLFHQSYKLPDSKLRLLLNYNPQRAMTPIAQPKHAALGIIHLGNKGNNLVKLNELGFQSPPGFIITTEVFRSREVIESYPPAEQNFKEQVARQIHLLEQKTGKKFGDPEKPLLFSVRSGSSISQPGMMDTFLNVGINEDIAHGIARQTGNQWFAWDNYRRFLQCYGMAFDLKRNDFDEIMRLFKKEKGITVKRGFTGEQMRDLALAYKKKIVAAGINILEDPFEQLLLTITKVLNSWESAKAKTYRKIIGISDDWGTAVTVQTMVYGNLSQSSGSGVFFTHNPKWSEDNLRLWGDFTIGNQGEDVVAGLVATLPISIIQQENEMRDTDITLETHFPEIYQALKDWANRLIYKNGWSPQEIEFTFESPRKQDLYILQSRNMSIRERKKVFTFDLEDTKEEKIFLGSGIGVSGGAMSGRAVFSLEEIDRWRTLEPETSLILIRGDTVPDDIQEINAADGLMTARGGVTSHAAVVAHRLGKTCVVGCVNLVCNEADRNSLFGDVLIKSGDFVSIDGQEGLVYQGYTKVKEA